MCIKTSNVILLFRFFFCFFLDMDTEFFGTTSPLDLSQKSACPTDLIIKQEPASEEYVLCPASTTATPVTTEHKLPTIVLATAANSIRNPKAEPLMLLKTAKTEPGDQDQSSSDSGKTTKLLGMAWFLETKFRRWMWLFQSLILVAYMNNLDATSQYY